MKEMGSVAPTSQTHPHPQMAFTAVWLHTVLVVYKIQRNTIKYLQLNKIHNLLPWDGKHIGRTVLFTRH